MALTDNMTMPVAPINNGFGNDGSFWLILLFLFAFGGGGWGNNYGSAPYVANDVQRGFDQSAIMSGLTGLNSTVSNGFAASELSRAGSNADLLQALWNMQMSQQSCCCDTRASIADLKYTIATENCLDRQVISDGIRDIIAANTASTQLVLDKLCDQEIQSLQSQLLTASQSAQTQTIINALKTA